MHTSKLLIFGVVAAAAASLQAASFDCAKASTRVEKDICSSPHLSNLDSEMGALYQYLVKGRDPAEQALIRDAQKKWLRKTRESATTTAELVVAYETWVRELRQDIENMGGDVDDIPTYVGRAGKASLVTKASEPLPTTTAAPLPPQPPPAVVARQPTAAAAVAAAPSPAPAALKPTVPATLEAKLESQGFRYMFGKEPEQWGRRIVTMDREGIRAFQYVQLQNDALDGEKDMVYFKCATKEIGFFPAGESAKDIQWTRVRNASEVARAWSQLCGTPIAWPARPSRLDTPWTAADEARSNAPPAPPPRAQAPQAPAYASDPVSELLMASTSLQGRCMVFRSTAVSTLSQIRQMRQAASMMPVYASNPDNPTENAARQVAETVLRAMRRERCA